MSSTPMELEMSSMAASGPDSKRLKMKQFIDAVREYMPTKAENIAIGMNRILQALSVTIDLSIFDPSNSAVAEFYVSLHELMSNLEQRSAISWNCVEVLCTACRNPAARNALIHTYQFLPPLSRLLGDQITLEKRIRLLTLMQELTCGIKISWQIPHLPHLMSTLTKWVESKDEQIVALSLGVLVNLCYKNLPAIYTLSRCVDIKKFLRTCLPLRGTTIEVHVSKLLILLDYLNDRIPEASYLKLIGVTFKSMMESYRASDSILLRHSVEFFTDVLKQENQSESILKYDKYDVEVERLLGVVENNPNAGDGKNPDPECMSLIFEFLYTLIEMNILKSKHLFSRILKIALRWIETDVACTQALSILRTVALKSNEKDAELLNPLLSGLPVFIMSLKHETEDATRDIEHNKRMGALLQLLRALAQAGSSRNRVLQDLKVEVVKKIFGPIVLHLPVQSDADTYSPDAINLFVFAVGLVDELAKHDAKWMSLYLSLMQLKQLHMILAQALYWGPKDVKTIILSIAGSQIFPKDDIVLALTNTQRSMQTEKIPATSSQHQLANNLCFPVMSVAKIEQLDEVLEDLKETLAQNSTSNISTSNVMELYEYKLAAMGHAERAANASVEAASEMCTHLKHRTAQLEAELSKIHQLLFHTQQCHEKAAKDRDAVLANNNMLDNSLQAEKGRFKMCSSQLKEKERLLVEVQSAFEETNKKLKGAISAQMAAEKENDNFRNVMGKLEENLVKKEKLIDRKDGELRQAIASNETLKKQKAELQTILQQTEDKLNMKNIELDSISRELEIKKHILNTITEVATSSSHV